MKRKSFFLLQAVLTSFSMSVATLSFAQGTSFNQQPRKDGTFFGYEATGKWMVGVKGAKVQNSAADYGDTTNVGFLFGYTFARPVGFNGSASVEFEGTTTTSDGDIGPASDFGPGATGQWDVDTMAIYFAYRTPGTVYFKGKLGGIASDVNSTYTGGTAQQDDASFAYGAGLGVRLGQVGKIEVEYTGASGDNDIGLISVGGILEF